MIEKNSYERKYEKDCKKKVVDDGCIEEEDERLMSIEQCNVFSQLMYCAHGINGKVEAKLWVEDIYRYIVFF